MSTLDQSFIKAYTKAPSSAGRPEDDRAAGSGEGSDNQDAAPATPALTSDSAVLRVDASHLVFSGDASVPHTQFPPADLDDLTYVVSPYIEELVDPADAAGPKPQQDSEQEEPDVQEKQEEPDVQEKQEEPGIPEKQEEPVAETSPSTIKLPDVFTRQEAQPAEQADACEDADPAAPTFAPEWEVDGFVWPDMCQQLLAAEAEYFRHVGERLQVATAEEHHVVMITSPLCREGRTTLALCLGNLAAQAGVEVALVDADLSNPHLGTCLGMEIPCGLYDVVIGKAPLKEAAVSSLADKVTLFPLSQACDKDIEPGDERLLELLGEISAHYSLVIVDIGALGPGDRHPFDTTDPSPVNAAIIVRDMQTTAESEAIATAVLLQESGIQAVGIAENFK